MDFARRRTCDTEQKWLEKHPEYFKTSANGIIFDFPAFSAPKVVADKCSKHNAQRTSAFVAKFFATVYSKQSTHKQLSKKQIQLDWWQTLMGIFTHTHTRNILWFDDAVCIDVVGGFLPKSHMGSSAYH